MEVEEVTAKARELAANLIADARNLEGPITWVTGNRHMPPMRSFPTAEEVWDLDEWDLWELFCETVTVELRDANVLLECPDYDNALYVVDLNRWAFTETPNPLYGSDDINSEWVRIQ